MPFDIDLFLSIKSKSSEYFKHAITQFVRRNGQGLLKKCRLKESAVQLQDPDFFKRWLFQRPGRLLTANKDIVTGVVSLPSFDWYLESNENGSYSLVAASSGGWENKLKLIPQSLPQFLYFPDHLRCIVYSFILGHCQVKHLLCG